VRALLARASHARASHARASHRNFLSTETTAPAADIPGCGLEVEAY
jgi:hypothetical protein